MLGTLKRFAKEVIFSETHGAHCLCCGDCCESFGGHLQASKHDKERWRREGREDILAHVYLHGWIWVEPETKELLERCPFLQETPEHLKICAIQETKPDICRDYPTLAHGKRCLHGVFL
jgi:Fe-S-cluster containining protein